MVDEFSRSFVITPDYIFDGSSSNLLAGGTAEMNLPDDQVLFGLTYWDTVEYVTPDFFGMVRYGMTDQTRKLLEVGAVRVIQFLAHGAYDNIFEIGGGRLRFGPTAFRSAIFAMEQGLSAHLERLKRNNWTLSERSPFKAAKREADLSQVLLFELNRAIPIVRKYDDVHKFMKWREDNKDALRRILFSSAIAVGGIEDAEELDPVIDQIKLSLEDAIGQVLRKGQEAGLGIHLGSHSVYLRYTGKTKKEFFHDMTWGFSFALPFSEPRTAVAVGVAGSVAANFKLGLTQHRVIRGAARDFPYESYLRAAGY